MPCIACYGRVEANLVLGRAVDQKGGSPVVKGARSWAVLKPCVAKVDKVGGSDQPVAGKDQLLVQAISDKRNRCLTERWKGVKKTDGCQPDRSDVVNMLRKDDDSHIIGVRQFALG